MDVGLHSWEGWTVALLVAALWRAPLRPRVAAWRDCAGLLLVAGTIAVSAGLRGSLAHVDSAAIQAMAGLLASRLIVEAERKLGAYRARRARGVPRQQAEHDTDRNA